MRALVFALVASTSALAQGDINSSLTAANQHLSLRAVATPDVVSAGSEVSLTFEVSPRRRVHVYAPGADYQVVAVKIDRQPGMRFRDVVYPESEIYHFEPLDEHVPVYKKPFTLTQVVGIGAAAVKGKESLTFSGKLEYQACDDKVCFKPNAIPFKLEVRVKR